MDIDLLRGRECLFALQETENWEASEMDVPGCVCAAVETLGRRVILCQICQLRRA